MEYILLGLLLLRGRTIYQLRDRITKSLSLMYSGSMGSIQAALKKLLEGGYISYKEAVESGKYKKIYSITARGRKYFYDWVKSPMEEERSKAPELSKVYFMGFADRDSRAEIIKAHLKFLHGQYEMMNLICEEAKSIKIPAGQKDVFYYQFVTAVYGKDLIKFNIDWYKNLLSQLEKGEI